MKRKRYGTKGFTLAELLIIIAIIGVLVAVAIPLFSGAVSKAGDAACLYNRQVLLRELVYNQLLGSGLSDQQVATILQESEAKCPTGGKYTVRRIDGVLMVECSIHKISIAQSVWYSFEDLRVNYKKYGIAYANNDLFRQYYYADNGGRWPTIESGGKTLYMQPYINVATGDIYVFANAHSDLRKDWNASMVYIEGKWYSGAKSIGIANKDLATIKKEIADAGWQVVSEFTESNLAP